MAAVMTYVATPVPICQPNPSPYTHGRYAVSQFSSTWRRVPSRRTTPRSAASAHPVAPTTLTATALADRSRKLVRPASTAAAAPSVAPPSTVPATNHVVVTHQRWPRLRSPRGVIVESIEWPHGDHVDRTAATTARTRAAPTSTGRFTTSS